MEIYRDMDGSEVSIMFPGYLKHMDCVTSELFKVSASGWCVPGLEEGVNSDTCSVLGGAFCSNDQVHYDGPLRSQWGEVQVRFQPDEFDGFILGFKVKQVQTALVVCYTLRPHFSFLWTTPPCYVIPITSS